MFKSKKYTKWIPLGCYHYCHDYIVMMRKNKNSGMVSFKMKKITNHNTHGNIINKISLDISKQFWSVIND